MERIVLATVYFHQHQISTKLDDLGLVWKENTVWVTHDSKNWNCMVFSF